MFLAQQKVKKEEEKNLIKNIKIKRKPIITQKSKKMTLKELQEMIKEELGAYMGEQPEDEVDVSVSDADVDAELGDEMGDEMAPEGEEDVLRAIYDLLAVHFGEGEEEIDMGDEMPMDDAEGEVAPDSDLEELSNHGVGKPAGKTSGVNAGYTTVKEEKTPLQERFQKLANII